jgi:cytochrome c553
MTVRKYITIAVALSAVVLLPGAFAADKNPTDAKPTSNINTDWLKNRFADETPEAIKLRSGRGDPVAGKEKSQLCQGCHGEFGLSSEPMIPHLAGQYAQYIAKNLRNFQNGERTHQIMSAMAATISDADLDDIAAYFASQHKMTGNGTGDTDPKAQIGKKLFNNGDMSRMIIACTNCHGVGGKGRAPHVSMFPVIGGQQAGYLKGQLLNWRSKERANSPNAIMNRIAKSLTDEEIDSLAEYVSTL